MQNETIDKLKKAGYITVTADSQGIADQVGISGGGGSGEGLVKVITTLDNPNCLIGSIESLPYYLDGPSSLADFAALLGVDSVEDLVNSDVLVGVASLEDNSVEDAALFLDKYVQEFSADPSVIEQWPDNLAELLGVQDVNPADFTLLRGKQITLTGLYLMITLFEMTPEIDGVPVGSFIYNASVEDPGIIGGSSPAPTPTFTIPTVHIGTQNSALNNYTSKSDFLNALHITEEQFNDMWQQKILQLKLNKNGVSYTLAFGGFEQDRATRFWFGGTRQTPDVEIGQLNSGYYYMTGALFGSNG